MSLPNFMCIGAAKSGTTSLYDILKQHSDVFIPSFKEPHFFDISTVYEHGVSWYEKTYFSGVKKEKCIGDFTPTYLFDKYAPERILALLGEGVKFIIILRIQLIEHILIICILKEIYMSIYHLRMHLKKR